MKKLITSLLTTLLLIANIAYAAGTLKDAEVAYAKKDYGKAVKIYTQLALQGDVDSQKTLALLYDHGIGVPQDYAEAFKWYKLAGEQGNSNSQALLGMYYSMGQGVVQNHVKAHMWLNLAAAQDEPYARDIKETEEKIMTPQQIAEAQKLAKECLARKYKGC
ncbi:Sel1-like repeat [Methylophilaceae bacterium]